MQHGVIRGTEPRGLPLSEKILPQYLKDLGYKTHLVGKWHLGHYKKEYLPLNRGFVYNINFQNKEGYLIMLISILLAFKPACR